MERLAPGYTLNANKDGNKMTVTTLNSYSYAVSRTERRKAKEGGQRVKGEDTAEKKGGTLGTLCCCASCREVLAKQRASIVPVGAAGRRDFCSQDLAKLPNHLSGLSQVVPWQKNILRDLPR